MTEKNEFEPDEVASLSSKAKWLEVELKILGQSIGYRSRILQTYVAFLQSSEEVLHPQADLCKGPVPICLLSVGPEALGGGSMFSIPAHALTHRHFILQGTI